MPKSKALSIAPSQLHWEYGRCPRCYWNQIHRIWKKPYTPFPSVFGEIDKAMREEFESTDTAAIKGMSPGGVIHTKEVRLKSEPFELGGKQFQYSCKTDAIAHFDGDCWAIYDFKTSSIDPDKLVEQYRPQLMCMAAALKDCENAQLRGTEVLELGLLCFEPTSFNKVDSALNGWMGFVKVPIDWAWWSDYESKLHDLLAGPCPEPTGDCQWCEIQLAVSAWEAYRESFSSEEES